MLKRIDYERAFSTPLFRFRLQDHQALNEELLALGARLRAEDPGVTKSNRGGWHSKGDLFRNDEACIRTLRGHARAVVLSATRKVSKSFDSGKFRLKLFAWMNMNPKGGFNAPHTHPGAHWSGVYYVSQPEVETGSSGMIEFLDPRSDLPNWRMMGAPAFKGKKSLRPEPGEMILFPSYLSHWVYPNEAEEERVTIAFNATFRERDEKG